LAFIQQPDGSFPQENRLMVRGWLAAAFPALANGQCWNILFTEGARFLAEKWASIMGMKENGPHGLPKIILVRKSEEIPIPGFLEG
jgi:hypothetical protein